MHLRSLFLLIIASLLWVGCAQVGGELEPTPANTLASPPTLAATAAPLPSPSPTPTQPALPTATAVPTQPPRYPTPSATLPAAVRVEEARFGGVSFFYDADLIADVRLEAVAAHSNIRQPLAPPLHSRTYYFDVPDYLVLELMRVADSSPSPPAQLVIQPLRTAEGGFWPSYPSVLTADWEIWANHVAEQTIPLDAQGQELLHPRFLETGNGRGLRTISTLDGELTYQFRGETEDGRYGVWWDYPLAAPRTINLDTLSASDFTPDLRQLDLMVQTLFVNSEASTASSVPRPEPNCTPDARFVADVNIPDGTTIAPRTVFTKTWQMQNTGSCTWSAAYQIAPVEWLGDASVLWTIYRQTTLAEPLAVTPPGGTAEVSLLIETPPIPGYYRLSWQLVPPAHPSPPLAGQPPFPAVEQFGTSLYMEVRVDQNAPVAIPQGAWVVSGTSTAASYPAGTPIFFAEDAIRVGDEVVCAAVQYTGRFVTGSERMAYQPFWPSLPDEEPPPYLELVETNCTADEWAIMGRLDVSASRQGQIVLALPDGSTITLRPRPATP